MYKFFSNFTFYIYIERDFYGTSSSKSGVIFNYHTNLYKRIEKDQNALARVDI